MSPDATFTEEELKEVREGFRAEAAEAIDRVEAAVLSLESGKLALAGASSTLRAELHSIKGSARAVGYDALSGAVHAVESFVQKADLAAKASIDRILGFCDRCRTALDRLARGDEEGVACAELVRDWPRGA